MTDVFTNRDIHQLHSKWGWLVALGLLLTAFGVAALANLFIATVASMYYIGAMMLVAGAIHLVHAFQVRGWADSLLWGASALLYTLAGFLAFTNPGLTAAVFTLIMAIALTVAGLFRLWVGFKMRPMKGAGWIMFAGGITALAGLTIAAGWPVNSLWILGLFLAIDLLMQGWALFSLGLAAKNA